MRTTSTTKNERDHRLFDVSEGLGNRPSCWTTALQDSFRGSSRSASFSMICNFSLFMLVRLAGLPDAKHVPRSG